MKDILLCKNPSVRDEHKIQRLLTPNHPCHHHEISNQLSLEQRGLRHSVETAFLAQGHAKHKVCSARNKPPDFNRLVLTPDGELILWKTMRLCREGEIIKAM